MWTIILVVIAIVLLITTPASSFWTVLAAIGIGLCMDKMFYGSTWLEDIFSNKFKSNKTVNKPYKYNWIVILSMITFGALGLFIFFPSTILAFIFSFGFFLLLNSFLKSRR